LIVYHIDKFACLQPGQFIKPIRPLTNPGPERFRRLQNLNRLYPSLLSLFGIQTLDKIPDKTVSLESTEFIMDYVRALMFPDLPSRLTVLFASRSVKSASEWLPVLALLDCRPQLVEIAATGTVYAANVSFRDAVDNRVSVLLEECHSSLQNDNLRSSSDNPLSTLGSTCLAACLEDAVAYWESVVPVRSTQSPPLYIQEELLIVPPARVLRIVQT